jgi:regulator of cell morphogenesis and NO signaling
LAAKVARVHGDRNPRLANVNELVVALTSALLPHLEYEEATLFPAVLATEPDSAALAEEFQKMKEEHLAVGELLGRLRDETESFSPPDWACTSYRTLLSELERLELDTLRHVHLENHVLAGPSAGSRVEAQS